MEKAREKGNRLFLPGISQGIEERAEKELGIPGLVLDSDQCDPRNYNKEVLRGGLMPS